MAVFFNDWILDNGLTATAAAADEIHLCSAAPTDFTEATATYALADYPAVMSAAGAYSGGPGRSIVSDADAAVTPHTGGLATHYALVDTANNRLLAVNPITPNQTLVVGVPVGVPAVEFYIEK